MNVSSWQTRTIMADGFNTRYLEAGMSGMPVLVLIHDGAFGTTAELCWSQVINHLAGDFHIFAPELLGWGGTDKAIFLDRSPYAGRIPHVTAFLKAVGAGPASFVGCSFGGSMILRAALVANNPWEITRGISISGTGGPYRLPSGIEALADYKADYEAAERLTKLIVGSVDGLQEHIKERLAGSLIPGHWESLMAPRLKNPGIQLTQSTDKFLEELRTINVPILLVSGLRDALLEPDWAQKLAVLSNRIEVVSLDVCHAPNIDRPELVVDLIRRFCAGDASQCLS